MRRFVQQMSPARRQLILDDIRSHVRMGSDRVPLVYSMDPSISDTLYNLILNELEIGKREREAAK